MCLFRLWKASSAIWVQDALGWQPLGATLCPLPLLSLHALTAGSCSTMHFWW